MIKLIGDKVRQIEREIELFNPGSLLTDLLVDSGPYKLLMQVLESFRPLSAADTSAGSECQGDPDRPDTRSKPDCA
jgi:hypothetical protein